MGSRGCVTKGVYIPPPVNRMADRCKIITFPQLRLRAVITESLAESVPFRFDKIQQKFQMQKTSAIDLKLSHCLGYWSCNLTTRIFVHSLHIPYISSGFFKSTESIYIITTRISWQTHNIMRLRVFFLWDLNTSGNPWIWVKNLLFGKIFAENCKKMK